MIISHYHQANLPPAFLFNEMAYIQFAAKKARGLDKPTSLNQQNAAIKTGAQNFHRLFYEHNLEIATLERDAVVCGFGGWTHNLQDQTLNLKFLYSLLHEKTEPVGSVLLDFIKNHALFNDCRAINLYATDYTQRTQFYQKRGFEQMSDNMSDLLVWYNAQDQKFITDSNPHYLLN